GVERLGVHMFVRATDSATLVYSPEAPDSPGREKGMTFRAAVASAAAGLVLLALQAARAFAADTPERVTFLSADRKTTLVGYVYAPEGAHPAHVPAVVMMHGRAGAYSTRANGVYDATTLSKRHQAWGRLWAEAGYLAVMVDGFGPRGYPQGFPRFSYGERPE